MNRYSSVPLSEIQRDEVKSLALKYRLSRGAILNMAVDAGLIHLKEAPKECLSRYVDSLVDGSIKPAPRSGKKPRQASPPRTDQITGTIYSVACPWCGEIISSICERSVQPGDVVLCDHARCEKSVEIVSLGDSGEVTVRRYNAPS
jgi:hypothetical protein